MKRRIWRKGTLKRAARIDWLICDRARRFMAPMIGRLVHRVNEIPAFLARFDDDTLLLKPEYREPEEMKPDQEPEPEPAVIDAHEQHREEMDDMDLEQWMEVFLGPRDDDGSPP